MPQACVWVQRFSFWRLLSEFERAILPKVMPPSWSQVLFNDWLIWGWRPSILTPITPLCNAIQIQYSVQSLSQSLLPGEPNMLQKKAIGFLWFYKTSHLSISQKTSLNWPTYMSSDLYWDLGPKTKSRR